MKNFKKSLTTSGLRNATFAVVTGFVIKVIFDYFCAKDLALNLSKATVLISNENIIDSISFANQVGRLDLISLLLALLGIIIGFGAVFGFLHIKETSRAIAEVVAKETAENYLKREELRELKEEANSAKKIAQHQKTNNKTKTSSEFAKANKYPN